MRHELADKKAELSELRKASHELIKRMLNYLLLNTVEHKNRRDLDLEGVVSSTTNINISDDLRYLLK